MAGNFLAGDFLTRIPDEQQICLSIYATNLIDNFEVKYILTHNGMKESKAFSNSCFTSSSFFCSSFTSKVGFYERLNYGNKVTEAMFVYIISMKSKPG